MEKKRVAVPLVCHGHSRPAVDLFYSPVTPDGFFLISASKDSSPMLRNGETGDWIGTFEGQQGAVWSCCLDTNTLRAATASADFSTKVWDALTGDELHSFEHKRIVRACAFSEDTQLLLTGGVEKILRIYDMNRPDAPPREVDKSPGSVRIVAWLHSDQTILSSCTDMGGVRIWDVRSGKIVQTLETKSSVTSAEVSQDGRYITTADGSAVKFWDANYYGLVKSYDMPCTAESASLEPKYGTSSLLGEKTCGFMFLISIQAMRLHATRATMVLSTVSVSLLEENHMPQGLRMEPSEYGRQAHRLMMNRRLYLQMDQLKR